MMKATMLWAVLCVLTSCKAKGQEGTGAGAPGSTRMGIQVPSARVPSLGEMRVSGFASELRVAPGGQAGVALIDAQTPAVPGVPQNLKVGALWAFRVEGPGARKVVNGVSNMPGGLMFSPDGRYLLALGAWDAAQQQGELHVQDLATLSADKRPLAAKVNYLLASPDSKSVAFVAEGVLHAGPLPAGPFRQLAGEVGTAEFAPNAAHLYFRRKAASGGGLYQIDLRAEKATPKRIVDQVGDFAISDDSKHVVALARSNPKQFAFELYVADAATLVVRKVSDDSTKFALSRDSKWLAYMHIATKAKAGALNPQDLQMGELNLTPLAGGLSRKVGARVREFEFTSDNSRLIFRDQYQELPLVAEGKVEKVGDLTTVALPDGAPKVIQRRCPNFAVSPDGKSIAYTVRIERPEYTRHLFVVKEGEAPVQVAQWLYEYVFTPDSSTLLFRTNCTRNGRSCDLRSQNLAKLGTEKPKVEAEATYQFKLSDDGKRIVYTYAHTTDEAFDVAVVNTVTQARKTIDQYVRLPVLFAGAGQERVVYLVDEKNRPGVYVASAL